jgi:hypothetical protein
VLSLLTREGDQTNIYSFAPSLWSKVAYRTTNKNERKPAVGPLGSSSTIYIYLGKHDYIEIHVTSSIAMPWLWPDEGSMVPESLSEAQNNITASLWVDLPSTSKTPGIRSPLMSSRTQLLISQLPTRRYTKISKFDRVSRGIWRGQLWNYHHLISSHRIQKKAWAIIPYLATAGRVCGLRTQNKNALNNLHRSCEDNQFLSLYSWGSGSAERDGISLWLYQSRRAGTALPHQVCSHEIWLTSIIHYLNTFFLMYCILSPLWRCTAVC